MRILYGVQGTGNGHISRARQIAPLLDQTAHVDYLFSGRDPQGYFGMQVFTGYRHRRGLSFTTRNGRIDLPATVAGNNPLAFLRETLGLCLDDYDLVITDFEPVTAWAAKRSGVPSIGIGHQYAFRHRGTPRAGADIAGRTVLRFFAPTTTQLGLHWDAFGGPLLPPVLDTRGLNALQRKASEHVLVYLPFENQQTVTDTLRQVPGEFIQVAPRLEAGQSGNVRLRPTSLEQFRADLGNARAVICNAGFMLLSECIHLGVPVLCKPLHGQMEQHSNALALTQLGYGQYVDELQAFALRCWLHRLPAVQPRPFPNVASAFVNWVAAGDFSDDARSALCQRLWSDFKQRNPTPLAKAG